MAKKTIFFVFIMIIFSNCATKNAFSNFNLSPKQTEAVDGVVYAQLIGAKGLSGVAAVVDLSRVYPKKFADKEVFYITFFVKENANLEQMHFRLDGKPHSSLQKLEPSNPYSYLIDTHNKWSNYFLVTFDKINPYKTHILTIELANKAKATVTIEKSF